MMQKNQSPPIQNTPHGGDSEKSQLNWVLQSQSELNRNIGKLLSDSKNTSECIQRIEKKQDDLLLKIEGNEKSLIKINTKLIVFSTIFGTAIVVGGIFLSIAGYFVNGEVASLFEFVQNLTEMQNTK